MTTQNGSGPRAFFANNGIAIFALIVSALSLVTSLASIYITNFYRLEDFIVTLRSYVGSNDTVSVNLIFANRGRQPVLVDDVALLRLFGPKVDVNSCDRLEVRRRGREFLDYQKSITAHNFEIDINGTSVHYEAYLPMGLFIDNQKADMARIIIDNGKTRLITAVFQPSKDEMPAIDCVLVSSFDRTGEPNISACPIWKLTDAGIHVVIEPRQLLPRVDLSCPAVGA